MIVRINKSVAFGSVKAPRSKSWAIRLILLSAISDEETTICSIPDSDDTEAALRMIEVLGSKVIRQGNCIRVIPNLRQCGGYVNVGGSGTVMRLGVALASSCRNPVIIDGDETLKRRPIRELLESLRSLGVNVNGDSLPVAINGPVKGNYVEIRGDLTSQYISGLIMLGLVSGITIRVIGDLVSRQYVDLTRRIIEESGCSVGVSNDVITVNECIPRISLSNVPGDYALSGFYTALALATGGLVTVTGLPKPLGYGDDSLVNIFSNAGARSVFSNGDWSVEGGGELRGIVVDLKDSPDLAPVVASIAPFASGETVITGVRHLAFKESNRLETISDSLRAFGVNVNHGDDSLRISGSITHGALIKCPNDHRIAMMSGVVAAGSNGESIIHNAECVNKSNRLFWRDLVKLGVKLTIN
ncbi:3-phosphoshikimate 1-carboxyvinyltransferase [Caldivirga maquilingensis]|uniref:3-phosphoshikimate 1-carboxyvinyltransferase n=1 Tax=Caldivirga maquilingensis (strain ATCC 700844 / DSM 13496 / JCM 10307 / IC-167) TaxID=397948 RepID=AROA_CALMQ|nr:3-phosphoshikimate 1-carboxyvinyltransferase [Caldivirga maquilingensis]A8MB38.1 RecName: Full=3-phosphoshikimate 1-carboxyvinyltransferase; AltName: Full=5-enolpyruvylshikimate-3-phosphate synthase; Short=EPSP synthase; Short=EPSPS [Caldivirga maquilingensis IC-167]ABW02667.1 3-phosphoshikimate 1-carboxyvinyltransferase [Caldivirga maquilingensis IC-167]